MSCVYQVSVQLLTRLDSRSLFVCCSLGSVLQNTGHCSGGRVLVAWRRDEPVLIRLPLFTVQSHICMIYFCQFFQKLLSEWKPKCMTRFQSVQRIFPEYDTVVRTDLRASRNSV